MTTQEGALVVTGGAVGIGAQIARRAAAGGRPVVVVYRTSATAAKELVGEIEHDGGRAVAIAADIGLEADAVRIFETAVDTFGSVTGLVNNAAETGERGRLADLRMEVLESVFRTNVFGAFLCAREAARHMATGVGGHGGAIVSLSSARAVKSGSADGWLAYAASKGALETMTRNLAVELCVDGIRVNTVRIGMIDTAKRRTQGEAHIAQLIKEVPAGRLGDPDDVAAAVLWLLSDEASYITGATLDVAGGL